jgi:hypothetical protein
MSPYEELLYLRHSQRVALASAAEEAAKPKPIIVPEPRQPQRRQEMSRWVPATLH